MVSPSLLSEGKLDNPTVLPYLLSTPCATVLHRISKLSGARKYIGKGLLTEEPAINRQF